MRKITAKILTLILSVIMLITVLSVPAMAEGYLNPENILGSVTPYTREQFVSDFEASKYTSVFTVEDGTYVNDVYTGVSATSNDDIYNDVVNYYGNNHLYGAGVNIANSQDTSLDIFYIRKTKTSANGTQTINEKVSKSLEIGEFVSGTNALNGWTGDYGNLYIAFGYRQSEKSSVWDSKFTDLRAKAVGFSVSNGSSGAYKFTALYSDGSTSVIEPEIPYSKYDKGYFVGFKAESGKHIRHICVFAKPSTRIDDICVILTDSAERASAVEVSGSATIKQPVYNVTASSVYTATVKNEAGNVMPLESVSWSLAESMTGASIDAATGKLSITHEFDTSKQIKVVATSSLDSSVKGEITVSVTETAPYYDSSRIKANATTYERDVFVKDLEKAGNISVLNFEVGSYNVTGTSKVSGTDAELISVPVSGTNAVMPITCKSYKKDDYNTYYGEGFLIRDNNSESAVRTRFWIPRNGWSSILTFDTSALGSLKPVAIGWLGSASDGVSRIDFEARIKCSGVDDTYFTPDKNYYTKGNVEFFAFRAPAGSYIESIEFCTGAWALIDDICIILEDPATSKPRFSKDEAGEKPIFEIADAAGAEKIYVNLPADSGATEKLILAAYDNSGMLLDVDLTDLSTRKAEIAIPTGKTVDTIKMFVWDSITKLIPVEGYAITIE